MKILLTSCLVVCLFGVSLFAQSLPKKDGRIFIPPEPCYMAVEDMPPIMGLHFGMKIDEVKKIHKGLKTKFMGKKPAALSDTDFYEVSGRQLTHLSSFKTSLTNMELTYQNGIGLTSILLNFRPPTKAGANALFEKITEETGLPGSYWLARDFGSTNYLQWDARCDGFSSSVVIQPGYFARLSLYASPGERQKRKPQRDDGPVGD